MTCVIPAIPLDTVRGRLTSRATAERIPLWGYIELIATCNFKCQHCYIAPCAEREDVMSPEKAHMLFEKLANAGALAILFTGGEIFTHKQFKEIYLDAKQHGFMLYLNTNAYMIGQRWADFLAEWPPEHVSISLYGLSDKRYEEVTGIPNAYTRVMRALDLLGERNLRYELKCPAMTLTVDEIPAMKALAESRGVRFRYDTIISPQEKGAVSPLQLQLAPKRVLELDEEMTSGLSGLVEHFDRTSHLPPDNRVYKCGAGRTALAINVHGGVSTCISSRQVVGNLFEQSFEEVWAMLGGKVTKRFPDGHPCATCRFRSICAGCPATVEQVSGYPDGYVQQYCKITHLRAHRVGLHPTGVPRTVTEGIPSHVRVPRGETARALPVLVS